MLSEQFTLSVLTIQKRASVPEALATGPFRSTNFVKKKKKKMQGYPTSILLVDSNLKMISFISLTSRSYETLILFLGEFK